MEKDKTATTITIADVAERVGVSKTTISRYLNGRFEFMSGEVRSRIQTVIEELNYRPNNLARSLKSSKSRLIGVIIADISNPFSSILVKGISDCCNRYGYNVIVANTNNDARKEQEYIRSMIDQRVEGLVVNTAGENDAFLKQIEAENTPVILADRPSFSQTFDTVRAADQQATLDAMKYLSLQGFSRVAFFTEPISSSGTRVVRRAAYREACENFLRIEPQEYVIDNADPEVVKCGIVDFIASHPEQAKAIFTANGVTMLSVLQAIHELGLKIPQDVGLCGFDDWPWMALVGNGITAIALPSYEIGTQCVERLMERFQGGSSEERKTWELPTRLIIRGSSQLR